MGRSRADVLTLMGVRRDLRLSGLPRLREGGGPVNAIGRSARDSVRPERPDAAERKETALAGILEAVR